MGPTAAPSILVLAPLLPPPYLICPLLAPGLWDPPRDEHAKQNREPGENVVDPSLAAQQRVHHRKELAHNEGGQPIGCQGPALHGADSLRIDELGAQDEGDWAQTDGEGGDKAERSDGAKDLHAVADSQCEEDRGQPHPGGREQDAGFPADAVREWRARGCHDQVEGRDGHGEERCAGGEQGGEQADAVHDYGVDAGELLGYHYGDYGDDGGAVGRVPDCCQDADGRYGGVMGRAVFGGAGGTEEGFFFGWGKISGCGRGPLRGEVEEG